MRIVTVEDEAIIRLDLCEILRDNGHEVVGEARDAQSAIAMIRATKPDCVFLDMQLHSSSGLEVLEEFKDERIAPFIMVTAFSQSKIIQQAQDLGAMAYIVKPFSEKDILPALQIAVARFVEATMLADEVSDLQARLETRKLVERAKGILMTKGMSEPEAFSKLQKAAMDSGKTLKAVAETVIFSQKMDL
ncbi:MAG: response regulator [Actinobacteria bacterium]|nr:response regulator [Actinomycetota bacterium]